MSSSGEGRDRYYGSSISQRRTSTSVGTKAATPVSTNPSPLKSIRPQCAESPGRLGRVHVDSRTARGYRRRAELEAVEAPGSEWAAHHVAAWWAALSCGDRVGVDAAHGEVSGPSLSFQDQQDVVRVVTASGRGPQDLVPNDIGVTRSGPRVSDRGSAGPAPATRSQLLVGKRSDGVTT